MGYEEYYSDLVIKLVFRHAHPDDPKPRKVVKKALDDKLDHDDIDDLIEEADENLSFVHAFQDKVWYEQNRECLEFIERECEVELWEIASLLSHLVPPSLRDEFDLPRVG